MITHGCTKTREYKIWVAMWQRCSNRRSDCWSRYGARGIKVCNRWNSFENFIADMGRRPTDGKYTLERRDNNGNYEPTNCYWATVEEQQNNKRNSLRLIFSGRVHTAAQWSRILGGGISRTAISCRMRLGWTVKETLTTPVMADGMTRQKMARRSMAEKAK